MSAISHPLTYAALDDLAFAAERHVLKQEPGFDFVSRDLGPLFEYVLLASIGLLPPPERTSWLLLDGSAELYRALTRRKHIWICPRTRLLGLYRTYERRSNTEASWDHFCFAAHRAALESGFSKSVAAQLVGAIGEMQSNIYEHSDTVASGIVAFKGSPGIFQFVVADQGIGVLESLRKCADYRDVHDHGAALQLALRDGVSRHGSAAARGYGFHPLFVGLANLNSSLRFRSGDHALTIEGSNPVRIPARLAKKTTLQGFSAAVTCYLPKHL